MQTLRQQVRLALGIGYEISPSLADRAPAWQRHAKSHPTPAAPPPELGSLDFWVNNAGSNGYAFGPLMEQSEDDLVSIVETNVLGTMLGCREAIRVMRGQGQGGHVYNMDGAGADGGATPRFAAYGATKRSLEQLSKSLRAELRMAGVKNVGIHNLSPGMVTTELLMAGAGKGQLQLAGRVLCWAGPGLATPPRPSAQVGRHSTTPRFVRADNKVSKWFINALAEEPATVAAALVPRMRAVPGESQSPLAAIVGGQYIRFLTKPRAYGQIIKRLLAGERKNKYVSED